jgi:hypothetical protein
MPGSRLEGFIGGSVWGVALKLVVLSLIVGFLLAYFEATPWDLFEWFQSQVARLWRDGWRVAVDFGRWTLLGAVLVVPIWLLTRVFARKR